MSTTRIEIGPTGRTVAANLRRLREARGLSLRALSRLITEKGRPLSVDALNKIENAAGDGGVGTRRVDVDDLVALAVLLGVNPSTLLLPPAADSTQVEVTTAGSLQTRKAWRWADGREPLKDAFDEDDMADFQIHARPKGRRQYVMPGERSEEELAGKRAALREMARQMNPDDPEGEAATLAAYRRLDREAWAGEE